MSAQFERVVAVIRSAEHRALDGDAVLLSIRLNEDLKATIEAIHGENAVRIFDVSGVEVYDDFADLSVGVDYKLSISKVQGYAFHISGSLREFLSFQGGRFLVDPPTVWYLLQEDYISGNLTLDDRVSGFNRLPAFLKFIDGIADFSSPRGVKRIYAMLGGTKLAFPVECSAAELPLIPSEGDILALKEEVLLPPRVKAKVGLYKRAVIRYLDGVEESARFVALIRGFASIGEIYEASRDNYLSEFEFEKLNEQFERKRQEYMVKIDAVCGDLLTKVLALPVAQAIVVSQYKTGADFANAALLFGSALLSVLGVAFVSNQVHAVKEIRKAAIRERDEVKLKHPELFGRIKSSYGSVIGRLRTYARLLPIIVSLLIFMSFLISAFGYETVNGCSECLITKLIDSQS